MKIGILGTADIAFRRFLPALVQCEGFSYAGVASRTPGKAKSFQEKFGGKVYDEYDALLDDEDIEAVYIPLPPALHYEWARKALERGKHVLLEKPGTTSAADTSTLVKLAGSRDLALCENYMFLYHRQISRIMTLISSGRLGETRLIRASFGFPFRGADDFRYCPELGGGSLLDCGGYTLCLARLLLGSSAKVTDAKLFVDEKFGVDTWGNAVLRNDDGLTAQVSFGMDNAYRCELEVWGSKALLIANRVFTAPPDMAPVLRIQDSGGSEEVEVAPDDSFRNSIDEFESCIREIDKREWHYDDMAAQSKFMDEVRKKGIAG